MGDESRTVADVVGHRLTPSDSTLALLGIDPDMPYSVFRRRLEMGERAEKAGDAPDAEWVQAALEEPDE